ncbi:Major facilitator superfamily domain-containing protein 7 [Hypsizygus marmoreus]|uniref:Major facilitator superfamily domain-containing protein 7 n=1 Tax=Hypsizygus marmoreus TaxID=39966 RepID=A0A369JTM9_HYPMA|nr:Major facilitator superfamily domain-containing protein 7 [Hypsizygus marmoreus]
MQQPDGSSISKDVSIRYAEAGASLELKDPTSVHVEPQLSEETVYVQYRLYRRRFAGVVGLVVLNIVAAMSWPWFGPISNNMVDEFGFTLDQVNWLGNIVSCVYLPTALVIPTIVARYGIRRCCDIGAVTLLLSAWLRYAGTTRSLSTESSYALVIIGQLFAAIAQPIFQVLGPIYSETWFNLQGRTTATMIVSIANPIGGAVGQLLSPLVGDTRQSILVLGILSTAVTPFVFLIGTAPPTPPTYAGSQPSQTLVSLIRAMCGLPTSLGSQMSVRERLDFTIVTLLFGALVGGTNSFAILSAQFMEPVGYSSDQSGFLGACLLLTGIVAAIVTAPLFDRVFTHHLAFTAKLLVPVVGGAWLSLIWAVTPHNIGGLFAIMTIIGVGSVTMLPVGLELGCELTRNANASSAVLWFAGNLFGVMFVLAEAALRAGPDAHPPLNMRKALVLNGTVIMAFASLVFLLQGRQVRKERDEQKLQSLLQLSERREEL